MNLGEIFSDSIKYPFSNISNFLFVGVLTLLCSLSNIVKAFGLDAPAVVVLASVLSIIFSVMLSGYVVSVIRTGLENTSEIPEINFKRNLTDGVYTIIISIVYYIVPIIITVVLAFITGVIGIGMGSIIPALGIFLIVIFIIFFIFSIFEMIALARFAKTGSLSEALSFGEVMGDVGRIGIGKIVLFIILSLIIIAIAYFINLIFMIIPLFGVIIGSVFIGAFIALFFYRALGLLYA